MGGMFTPDWLMSQLNSQMGSPASTVNTTFSPTDPGQFPPSSPSAPAATPSSPPPPPIQSQPQQQPSAPQQAQPDPSQQRIQGVKGYLANILHGVGEGMKSELGLETDTQRQQRLFTQNLQTQKANLDQQNIQSEIAQRMATVKQMQSAVTLPNGMQVPFA